MAYENWGDAFNRGLEAGLSMAQKVKHLQARRVLAKDLKNVGTETANPQQYSTAMGLSKGGSGPNSQAGMLAQQDASVGATGARTADALNSTAPGTATATGDGMTPYSYEDAYQAYLKDASAKGLISPSEYIKGLTSLQQMNMNQARTKYLGVQTADAQAKLGSDQQTYKLKGDQARIGNLFQSTIMNVLSAQTPQARAAAVQNLIGGLNSDSAPFHGGISQNGATASLVSSASGQAITLNLGDPTMLLQQLNALRLQVLDPKGWETLTTQRQQLADTAAFHKGELANQAKGLADNAAFHQGELANQGITARANAARDSAMGDYFTAQTNMINSGRGRYGIGAGVGPKMKYASLNDVAQARADLSAQGAAAWSKMSPAEQNIRVQQYLLQNGLIYAPAGAAAGGLTPGGLGTPSGAAVGSPGSTPAPNLNYTGVQGNPTGGLSPRDLAFFTGQPAPTGQAGQVVLPPGSLGGNGSAMQFVPPGANPMTTAPFTGYGYGPAPAPVVPPNNLTGYGLYGPGYAPGAGAAMR